MPLTFAISENFTNGAWYVHGQVGTVSTTGLSLTYNTWPHMNVQAAQIFLNLAISKFVVPELGAVLERGFVIPRLDRIGIIQSSLQVSDHWLSILTNLNTE